MRTLMARWVQALKAEQGTGRKRHVQEMTDAEIYRTLDVRDPETGALHMDLTDDELEAMLYNNQARPARCPVLSHAGFGSSKLTPAVIKARVRQRTCRASRTRIWSDWRSC